MKLWAFGYTLRARAPLSGIAKSLDRQGSLLKVETTHGIGYADVHPWAELGDAPLERQLALIVEGRPTSLGTRSLALAELDARARAAGNSAFAQLPSPPTSHRLVSWPELSPALLTELSAQGFRTLKLKIGADPERELRALSMHETEFAGFKLRLDANGQLTSRAFFEFVSKLAPKLKASIEFVEDPIATGLVSEWLELNKKSEIPLAIDRLGEKPEALASLRAPWIVLKPAIQNPTVIEDWAREHGARIAVTSYLDHPVGQAGAALEAARLSARLDSRNQARGRTDNLVGTCGLVSHSSYEASDFSEALSVNGPEFLPPKGTGIGFDELLSRLDWRSLR